MLFNSLRNSLREPGLSRPSRSEGRCDLSRYRRRFSCWDAPAWRICRRRRQGARGRALAC